MLFVLGFVVGKALDSQEDTLDENSFLKKRLRLVFISVLRIISRVKGKRRPKAPKQTPIWDRNHLRRCCISLIHLWIKLVRNILQNFYTKSLIGT
ncbi:hypothetical protein llap_15554 [Limosa lapponica baueri]|uniref:Uncharacterized protein n=1 Tax=Limosa lapponica baueri TaxID=1758121 RepID=A0A2I0TK37_LIMLA|nr:hypothetical protein llap_15554 [Limosa lapponica baueri]